MARTERIRRCEVSVGLLLRFVYDYDKMVQWIVETQGWDELEAVEWIEYNTIRALPYMGEGAPIVMYGVELDE